MTEDQEIQICAQTELHRTSALRNTIAATRWIIETDGVGGAAQRGFRSLVPSSFRRPVAKTPSAPIDGEVLGLKAGELVEVKSEEEIRALLNKYRATRGLFFMDEMWKFCGQRFRVLKPLDRVVVETTGEVRELKNTVLLDGVHCDGSAHKQCAATCYHYWREAWLRRVDEPDAEDAELSEGDSAATPPS